MKICDRLNTRVVLLITIALLALPAVSLAQTDEIQVYDASIAERGVFNLTLHNNFTPDGLNHPAFPGGLIPDKSLNGVAEWAYGVADWFEAGLYLPLYSISKDRGASINGGKLRMLFVRPHAAERTFFYGMNFEFSYNAKHWDARRYTSEIRPIIGVHLHPVDIIVNPILDNSYTGGFKGLDFAPADFGLLRHFLRPREQSQQLYAVVDHTTEAGIGFGLTSASDKVTLKLILSRDLYVPNKK